MARSQMDDRERLIGLIYGGVANEEVWQQLLARLVGGLNAAGTGLGLQDMATHEFRAVADAGIDRGLHETYVRLAPENRIWQAIGRAGRPMADWMVMPKSELVGSPLYAEWFAPQGFHGVMAAPILARDSLSGVVVAFCSKSRIDFGESDLDLMAGFAPHLGRAVGRRLERERSIADLRADRQILDHAEDAVLLLDGGLQVIHANAAATALLGRGDGTARWVPSALPAARSKTCRAERARAAATCHLTRAISAILVKRFHSRSRAAIRPDSTRSLAMSP